MQLNFASKLGILIFVFFIGIFQKSNWTQRILFNFKFNFLSSTIWNDLYFLLGYFGDWVGLKALNSCHLTHLGQTDGWHFYISVLLLSVLTHTHTHTLSLEHTHSLSLKHTHSLSLTHTHTFSYSLDSKTILSLLSTLALYFQK